MLAEVPFVGLVAAFLPPRVFGKISLRERAERLIPRLAVRDLPALDVRSCTSLI